MLKLELTGYEKCVIKDAVYKYQKLLEEAKGVDEIAFIDNELKAVKSIIQKLQDAMPKEEWAEDE